MLNGAVLTLHDLWLLIIKFRKWVLIVPLLSAVILGGGMCVASVVTGNYTATSVLTVADSTGLVGPTSLSNLINVFAQDVVASMEGEGFEVSAQSDAASQSVEFSAVASNEEQSIDLANMLAEKTEDVAMAALREQGDAYLAAVEDLGGLPSDAESTLVSSGATSADRAAALRSCFFTISPATEADRTDLLKCAKYALIGLLGGLFVVVCALVFYDALRHPIKSRDDLSRVTDFPVLAEGLSATSCERMIANVSFLSGTPLGTLCIIPASGHARNDLVELLKSSLNSNCGTPRFKNDAILGYDSPEVSMNGVCAARKSDATVIVVRPWQDRASNVEDSLAELKLAKANVVGIVLA